MTKSRKWLCWVALACFLAVLALDLYVLIGPINSVYDSDSSDTLMWAEAAYEAGGPVNHDFYYATVLPFGGQLLMLPFLSTFGVSLTTHILGMCLFWLLLSGALLGFFRAMQWSWTESLFASAFTLLLFGAGRQTIGMYFQHIIYYSLATLFMLVGMNLILRIIRLQRESPQRRVALYALCALLGLWFLLTATNGAMSLALFCVPCAGAYALERLLDMDFRFKDGRRQVGLFVIMAVGIVAGFVLGKKLAGPTVGEYGNFFSTFSLPGTWGQNLCSIPAWWVDVWSNKITEVLFLSRKGVLPLFSVGCAIVFAVVPVFGLICYRKLESRCDRLIVLMHWILTALLLFGIVFGKIGSRMYNVQATSILCTLVVLRFALRRAAIPWKRFAALVAAVVGVFSATCGVGLLQFPAEGRAANKYTPIIEYLESQNLSYGYATWWNCNAVTVLSDSRVKLCQVKYKESWKEFIQDTYQSNAHWYAPQEDQDRYFVMLTEDEYEQTGAYLPQDSTETLREAGYVITVYDDFPFGYWYKQ